jgi:superfamily II DNA or RNA helicase
LFITEKLQAKRTLVLLPSLSLLKQTLNEWRANCTNDFASLPVCSDDTVASTDDAAIAHTADLGVPVTTDPKDIAAFLRRRSGPLVVFSTYQSSPQIAKAFALGRVPGFDLIIADEAHRVAGPVSSDFATVLDPVSISGARRLFMTATPRYFTGRVIKAAQEADYEVASMDDETRFGPVFHRLSFGEAIDRELLTDYQVAIVGVDDATYQQWAEKGTLVTRDGTTIESAASLAGQIGLAKAMRKYDLRRVISFHSRVKRAQDFAASMPDVVDWMPARQRPKGRLWSDVASGEMPAGDRYRLLQHLGRLDDAERGLLANARCLSEGVDVPTLDGVAFIDPRRSEVDIVQAVGRAIRKSEAKIVGTIVIPVFVDNAVDPVVALDSSVFKPVWDVIQALRAHDAELGEQLDALRREMGRKGGKSRLPDKIHVDVPATVGADFARAFDVRLVEQTTASWEFWYGLLQKYVAEHGTARVTQRYSAGEGHNLGSWVSGQRGKWETLSEERKTLLRNLPGWTLDVHGAQWDEGFEHLRRYVADHGDARVRDDYVAADGYRLGKWVGKQRTKWDTLDDSQQQKLRELPGWILDARGAMWEQGFESLLKFVSTNGHARPLKEETFQGYKLGAWVSHQRLKWDDLDPERQQRLAQLPGWTTNTLDDRWERGFTYLEHYVADQGGAHVPQSYNAHDGYALGKWVSVQRRTWDSLSEDRRNRLAELPGWTLDARQGWWERGFRHLQDYVAEFGTARVSNKLVYNGFLLGSWAAGQKQRWNSLSEERRSKLESLPGWTINAHTAQWEEAFTALEDYVRLHGDSMVPSSTVLNGINLGVWINSQRTKWSKLTEERRKRLEALPGWTTNTRDAAWEEGFEFLSTYVDANGNARVPEGFIYEGFRLGQWVRVQRSQWTSLIQDRQQRLSALPGWVVSVRDAWWEEGFSRLQQYTKEHGSASPPQSYSEPDGYSLGSWIATQRASWTAGKLAPERKQRLESLPGWEWNPRGCSWDSSFGALENFVAETGHACPAQAFVDRGGHRLGAWVTWQRTLDSKGSLTPDQRSRLEALPGWQWNTVTAKWEDGFRHLEDYIRRHGNACPPRGYISSDGYPLGSWVTTQRTLNAKGNIAPLRHARLSALAGWQWKPPRGAAATKLRLGRQPG